MNPIMVKRSKVYYNDDRIVDDFASATAIRKLIKRREYEDLRKVVPRSTYKILSRQIRDGNIVLGLENFEKEIIYTLRKMSIREIANLPDVSEGLENLIKNSADNCNDMSKLIANIKSKRYTQTRIQRILLYALLGIDKKMMEDSKKVTPYVRVLGFTNKGKELISEINKRNSKINMITSVKKFIEKNNKPSNRTIMQMLQKDIFATDVYTLGFDFESKANLDFTNNMIITN